MIGKSSQIRWIFIIIYMTLAASFFIDVVIFLPYVVFSNSIELGLVGAAVLVAVPLVPIAKDINKREIVLCSIISYLLICYILTFKPNMTLKDYLHNIMSGGPFALLYLIIQWGGLFSLRWLWEKIGRIDRYVIMAFSIVLFWSYWCYCYGWYTTPSDSIIGKFVVALLQSK